MNVWCPAHIGSHCSTCKKSLGGIHWISPKGSFGTNHLTKGTNNQKDQGSTSVSIKKTRKLSKKGRNRFLILSLKTECKFCCDSWDLKKIITVKKINVLFQNWDNFTILHFSLMRIKWICTQYNYVGAIQWPCWQDEGGGGQKVCFCPRSGCKNCPKNVKILST